MTMTMTKTIIIKIIIIIIMIMRIKFGNPLKIEKCQNRIKSIHTKAIHIYLKGEMFRKPRFIGTQICKYQKQSIRNKIKKQHK